VSEEQASIAQHTLTLLRRMDTKPGDVLMRLSSPERRFALEDEELVLDRIAVVDLRQHVERLGRRLDPADSPPPPAA
jgi:hypothetical protein